jgi:nucleoside-triphosphatase THEP1
MAAKPIELILWTGAKHSGKTTAAAELVRRLRAEGFCVAGLLAPAVYQGDELTGFDAIDLRSGKRTVLVNRAIGTGGHRRFEFTEGGLSFGKAALNISAARSADIVMVDEFGPLELSGGGWREEVDRLLCAGDSVVMLVVRDELAEKVGRLYSDYPARRIGAARSDAAAEVMRILGGHRFAETKDG